MTPEENKQLILAELDRLYPQPKPELHFTNPYETLVAVMLSAQCTDKQVNKVTPAVFARFPDVKSMAEADAAELYPLVKSCGFKSKASNIIAACRMILAEDGGEVPHTMEALTRLPGVGRKTANVVMSTAFHIPAIAVDTHVFSRQQPPWAGGCARRAEDGDAAARADSAGQVERRAPLADFPRSKGVQGPAPPVRRMHAAPVVQEVQQRNRITLRPTAPHRQPGISHPQKRTHNGSSRKVGGKQTRA